MEKPIPDEKVLDKFNKHNKDFIKNLDREEIIENVESVDVINNEIKGIKLNTKRHKDNFINEGEENVDMVNEGPYTMHIQSSMFEQIRMDGDDDGNDRNVGSNGENRYGNNIGKHFTKITASTVFSMSLILAIIGVICIIVFREISPPPVIPHA